MKYLLSELHFKFALSVGLLLRSSICFHGYNSYFKLVDENIVNPCFVSKNAHFQVLFDFMAESMLSLGMVFFSRNLQSSLTVEESTEIRSEPSW